MLHDAASLVRIGAALIVAAAATACPKEKSDLFPLQPSITLVSTPAGSAKGLVVIDYDFADAGSDVGGLTAEYSVDAGRTWRLASEEGAVPGQGIAALSTNRGGVRHRFVWDSILDLGFIGAVNTWVRLTPRGGAPAMGGPFLLDNTFSPRQRAFVSLSSFGAVAVVDTLSFAITDYIRVQNGSEGMCAYVSGGIEYLAVACYDKDVVAIVNLSTHVVEQTIAVGDGPVDVDYAAGTSGGDLLLVANSLSDNFTPIGIATGNQLSVQASIGAGDAPLGGVTFVSGGVHYYALANRLSNTLTVRDLDAGSTSTYTVGAAPHQPVFKAMTAGDRLFVPNLDDGTVSVLDPGNGFAAIADTPIRTGANPRQVLVGANFLGTGPDEHLIAVFNAGGAKVYRFNADLPPAGREFAEHSPLPTPEYAMGAFLDANAGEETLYVTRAELTQPWLDVYRVSLQTPAHLARVLFAPASRPSFVLVR